MEVKPRMEHGRWIAQCPVCKMHNLVKHDTMVCTTCNPDLLATKEEIRGLSGRQLVGSLLTGRPMRNLERAMVADTQRREAARRKAIVYTAVYTQPKTVVEKLLRPRRKANMNWFQHETLDQLRAENLAHGLGN